MPKVVMRETPPLETSTARARSLKRTSSNASLASLPTPPRTIHKRKRSRSRASSVHESGDESDASVSERHSLGKRRKIVHTKETEAKEEEEFWIGVTSPVNKPSTSAKPDPVARAATSSPEESPRIMTRTQYKESRTTTVTGLQSPPPSRRQPERKVKRPVTPQPLVAPRTPRTPRTPRATARSPGKTASKGKSKAKKVVPVRDSPNNPFLDDDVSKPLAPPRFKTPEPKAPVAPLEERKTVTYVFRGHRQELLNPLYGYKPSEQSKLPPEHPDFSPDLALPPKLLFPMTPTRRSLRSAARGRSPSPGEGDKIVEPLVFKTPKKQTRFVDTSKEPKSSKKSAEVGRASSSKKESSTKKASKGKISLMDRTLEEKEKKSQASTAVTATTSGKGVVKNKRL